MEVIFKGTKQERDALQEFIDHAFPTNPPRIVAMGGLVLLKLAPERGGNHVFDQLRIEAELPTYTDFDEAQALAEAQHDLNFTYPFDDPIYATAG